MNEIANTLNKIYTEKNHRIVFWYDDKGELRQHFDEMAIDGVEKVHVDNTEFQVKFLISREKREQNFLLYFTHARPANEENWLLDLLLANYEFQTDRAGLITQELDMDINIKPVIAQYIKFFNNRKNLTELKKALTGSDTVESLQMKMLGVVCRCEGEISAIFYALIENYFQRHQAPSGTSPGDICETLEGYGLEIYLWKLISVKFGYTQNQPSIKDFIIELFQHSLQKESFASFNPPISLNHNAIVLLSQWKNDRRYEQYFKKSSEDYARDFDIDSVLSKVNYKDIGNYDLFKHIEEKILREIKQDLLRKTIPASEALYLIENRKKCYWYKDYEEVYLALTHAIHFDQTLLGLQFNIASLPDGLEQYSKTFFKVDYHYRKFKFFLRRKGHIDFFTDLDESIEERYLRDYVIPLNNAWSNHLPSYPTSLRESYHTQPKFYQRYVEPFVKKDNRIFVIISDGLRYESAHELKELLLKEDRFQANIHCMLGCLPSYTQLGMAALLPHDELEIDPNKLTVKADGLGTQGVDQRGKFLESKLPQRSIAINAEDFTAMNASDGRDFVKKVNVIYIYHNSIDKTGDDAKSEDKVFDATQSEFDFLIKLIKKITNANGNHVLITSDHGYLYQAEDVDQPYYLNPEKFTGELSRNRRFITGHNLFAEEGYTKFTSNELGLTGKCDFLFPTSIKRIRRQGSGSRYVHGGVSIQEMAIPVIEFTKKRREDIRYVEIHLLKTTDEITSHNPVYCFYQQEPVKDKVLPRELSIAFYDEHNRAISDIMQLRFDSTSSDGREREKNQRFTLSDLECMNNKSIYMKLLERIPDSTKTKVYQEIPFKVRVTFSRDFDI